jgi:hypothetical protein
MRRDDHRGSSWLARCCVTNAAVAERDGEQIVNVGDFSTSRVVKVWLSSALAK